MDTRVPAGSVPSDEGASPSPSALERRLAALEARLDDLDEAIRDAVPVATRNAVEAACREVVPPLTRAAVQEELEGVRDDLRRAIAELGRLLLRDLDRLTKVLADHRDTIVDRLLGPEEPQAATEGREAEAPTEGLGLADSGLVDTEPSEPASGTMTGEEGRWRPVPGRLVPGLLLRHVRRTRRK